MRSTDSGTSPLQDDAGDSLTESGAQFIRRSFGVFNGVMQQSRHQDFDVTDATIDGKQLRQRQRVIYVRAGRDVLPPLVIMFLCGEPRRIEQLCIVVHLAHVCMCWVSETSIDRQTPYMNPSLNRLGTSTTAPPRPIEASGHRAGRSQG